MATTTTTATAATARYDFHGCHNIAGSTATAPKTGRTVLCSVSALKTPPGIVAAVMVLISTSSWIPDIVTSTLYILLPVCHGVGLLSLFQS